MASRPFESEYEEVWEGKTPAPVDRRALVEYLEREIRMIRRQKSDPDCESFVSLSLGGTIAGYQSIIDRLVEGDFEQERPDMAELPLSSTVETDGQEG